MTVNQAINELLAMQNPDVNGAFMEIAQEIEDKAKGYVPVRTGTLQSSIGIQSSSDEVSVGVHSGTAGYSYSAPVQARSPYLEPAAYDVVDKIPDAVIRKLSK